MPDLVLWDSPSYGVYIVSGAQSGGFDLNARVYFSGATPFNWQYRDLADLNGDGFPDLIFWNSEKDGLYTIPMSGTWPDLLISIASGRENVTNIKYQSIAANSGNGFYVKDVGESRARFPKIDVQGPIYAVASVRTSNGIGGGENTAYTYGGLKAEMGTGRGMLGFRWVQAKQVETGLSSYTEYQQSWPYTGLPILQKKTLAGGGSGGVWSQTVTTYGCNDAASTNGAPCAAAPGKRYFVYAKQGVERSFDYNGAPLPAITTTTEYDNWGNATKVEVSTDDGFKKSTVNSYSNDSTNWLLGRLLRSSVTSTSP